MFQRFHENTQMSRVVKNILATEPIPLLQTVQPGTPLLKGCKYLYDGRVINCTESGPLTDNFIALTTTNLSTSTHKSSVSWYDDATHKYLGNYLRYLRDTKSVNLMPYYNCYNAVELTDVYLNTADISALRCSDDMILDESGNTVPKVTPRDSPPLYCGVYQKYDASQTYGFGNSTSYKVVAVPIKFDTTYTVAVESRSVVSLRGIIYDFDIGMIKEYDSPLYGSTVKYYSDYLNHSCMTLPFTKFSEPFTYRVDLASSSLSLSSTKLAELYSRQNNLYMVLQLPANVDSSIVVLEGTYTQRYKEITENNCYMPHLVASTDEEQYEDVGYVAREHTRMQELEITYSDKFVPEDLTVNPSSNSMYPNNHVDVKYPNNLSLLYYNTGVSYAFSDRLIEYLLLNVVTGLETLSTNISRVQDSLKTLYPSYEDRLIRKVVTRGMWDDSIVHYIKSLISENSTKLSIPLDHDGYINKDVEELLSQKGVYVT